jgi:rhomboid protease GluP
MFFLRLHLMVMEIKTYIKENWLTKNPKRDGLNPTLFLMSLLLFTSFIYINNFFNAPLWMSATGEKVFLEGEWWRAWTTMFAHADFTHIASNLFLFFPFSYYLIGYFGYGFFPLFGFFIGGLVNLLVLQTMPAEAGLIGVSGVVYWMGGAWLALSWLVDRRESNSRRVLKVIAVTIVLFVPDSFKPEVSYLCHFLGYFAGVGSAILYYFIFKKKFDAAIVLEEVRDDEYDWTRDFEFIEGEGGYLIDYNEDPKPETVISLNASDSLCHQKGC